MLSSISTIGVFKTKHVDIHMTGKAYFKNLFRVFYEPSMLANRFWRDDVIYPITTWFNPRQKWLTKVIPNTWCDKVELIPLVNFAILIDFVEKENGLNQLDMDWEQEMRDGHVSQDYIDKVMHVYGELKAVYNYIKVEKPQLEKDLENSYPKRLVPIDQVFIPLPCGGAQMASTETIYGGSYNEVYAVTNRLEKLIDEKDTWALQKIIEHRHCLWT
jgi:hypothetical protein